MPSTKILASDIVLGSQSLTTTKTEFEDDDLITSGYVQDNFTWDSFWNFNYSGNVPDGYYWFNIESQVKLTVIRVTVGASSGSGYFDFLSGLYDAEYPVHEEYLFNYDSSILKEWRYDGVVDGNSTNYKEVNFVIKSGNAFCFHLFNSSLFDLNVRVDLVRDYTEDEARTRIIYDEVANYSRLNVNCVDFGTTVARDSFYEENNNLIYFAPASRADKYFVKMNPDDGSYTTLSMPDISGYDKPSLNISRGERHRNGKIYYPCDGYDCWVVFDPSDETFDYKTTLELSDGAFSLANPIGVWSGNFIVNNEGEIYYFSQSSALGFGYIYYIDKLGVLKRKIPPVDFWPSNVVYYAGKFNEAQSHLNGKLLYGKHPIGYTMPIYSYDYRKNAVVSVVNLSEAATGGNHYVSERSNLIVSGATRAPNTSTVYYSFGDLLTSDSSYGSFSVSLGGGSSSRNISHGPNDCAMQIVQTGGGSSLNRPGALFCHDCRTGYPGVVTPKTTLGNIYFERNYWYGVIGDKIPGKAVFYFYWYDNRVSFNTIILSWNQIGTEEY